MGVRELGDITAWRDTPMSHRLGSSGSFVKVLQYLSCTFAVGELIKFETRIKPMLPCLVIPISFGWQGTKEKAYQV
jgi:hypothetical protein